MNKILYTTGIIAVLLSLTVIWAVATTDATGDMPPKKLTEEYTVVELITVHEDTPETETSTETAVEVETTSTTESSTTLYYNVNLPEYIQDVIFAECAKYGIPPSIVIAMIEKESHFDCYGMGDDGRSFGLMQVQPKNHLQRMIQMGCTDLFDPIQNVKVGINYLGECYNRYGSIDKALVAYNSGSYNGTITNYAVAILSRANEI